MITCGWFPKVIGWTHSILKRGVLYLTIVLFSSCSVLDVLPNARMTEDAYSAVRPTADFPGVVIGMILVDDSLMQIANEVCIAIDARMVWNPGDFWDTEADAPNLVVALDGDELEAITISVVGPTTIRLDVDRNIVGQHPGQFMYCVLVDPSLGDHTMSVRIDLPELDHEFSWEFARLK